jgi:hypothetical protein
MKKFIFIALLSLIAFAAQAQSTDSTGRLGFTIHGSINGVLPPVRIVPSVSYTKGKNQFELGVGFHPFNLDQERVLSLEFNQKHYPNRMSNKYNMYFISRAALVNNRRNTFYPATYTYLFLNAGYGFDVHPVPGSRFYMGTNMTMGAFTYSKQSDTAHEMFESQKMFQSFGYHLSLQVNVGYRF